jgi:hypothetical protein
LIFLSVYLLFNFLLFVLVQQNLDIASCKILFISLPPTFHHWSSTKYHRSMGSTIKTHRQCHKTELNVKRLSFPHHKLSMTSTEWYDKTGTISCYGCHNKWYVDYKCHDKLKILARGVLGYKLFFVSLAWHLWSVVWLKVLWRMFCSEKGRVVCLLGKV